MQQAFGYDSSGPICFKINTSISDDYELILERSMSAIKNFSPERFYKEKIISQIKWIHLQYREKSPT